MTKLKLLKAIAVLLAIATGVIGTSSWVGFKLSEALSRLMGW